MTVSEFFSYLLGWAESRDLAAQLVAVYEKRTPRAPITHATNLAGQHT